MPKVALTQKHLRLQQYNQILTSSKKLFKPGSTFTRDQFVKLFALSIPATSFLTSFKAHQRANLTLVKAQAEINYLLRQSGLNMKSCDYYNSFYIQSKEGTKNTILNMLEKSEVHAANNTVMVERLKARVTRNNWGTYNKVPQKTISRLKPYTPSHQYDMQKAILKPL
jgi:hypothetical protein